MKEKKDTEIEGPKKSCNTLLRAYKLSTVEKKYGTYGKLSVRSDIKNALPKDIELYQAKIPGVDGTITIGSTTDTFNQFKNIKIKIGKQKEITITKSNFLAAGTSPINE